VTEPDAGAEPLSVEATGETVGEAKWLALRELERAAPGVDKAAVRFQVVSEGERGLLGVGYEPARVVATADPAAVAARRQPRPDESAAAAHTRELLERIAAALGLVCTIRIDEDDESIAATCEGDDLGLLIGRHGQTIDAVQHLANAIVFKGDREHRKRILVDAAGYRGRREEALHREALRAAEQALASGARVELEPMSAIERRVVHERLKDYPGVRTESDGAEPNRRVVVFVAS
jgi:spoIIIJ-associated protein